MQLNEPPRVKQWNVVILAHVDRIRPGKAVHKVSPLRRMLCIPVVMLSILAGVGPFVDAGSFTSPLFGPIRSIAPLRVWGAAWLTAAVFALVGAIRGAWGAYTTANVIVAGLSALWLGTLIYARWWLHIPLSFTAIGLWLFPLGYSLVVTLIQAEVVEREPTR